MTASGCRLFPPNGRAGRVSAVARRAFFHSVLKYFLPLQNQVARRLAAYFSRGLDADVLALEGYFTVLLDQNGCIPGPQRQIVAGCERRMLARVHFEILPD